MSWEWAGFSPPGEVRGRRRGSALGPWVSTDAWLRFVANISNLNSLQTVQLKPKYVSSWTSAANKKGMDCKARCHSLRLNPEWFDAPLFFLVMWLSEVKGTIFGVSSHVMQPSFKLQYSGILSLSQKTFHYMRNWLINIPRSDKYISEI